MFDSLRKIFSPDRSAIGVSFGTHTIRLAHCGREKTEHTMLEAATCPVPDDVQTNPAVRSRFYVDALKTAIIRGKFTTRRAVLGIPNYMIQVRQLRVPKVEKGQLSSAIEAEISSKLPTDLSRFTLRHSVAGDVQNEQGTRQEVIVFAIETDALQKLLADAESAGLDVVGVSVEPKAVVDCFAHVYRRKADEFAVSMFIDVGASGTRCIIAQGSRTLFTRAIAVGGEELGRPEVLPDDTTLLRSNPGVRVHAVSIGESDTVSTTSASNVASSADSTSDLRRSVISRLADELDMCRRYHEVTFTNLPIDRLMFVGGASQDHSMLRLIADRLQLPVQLADPMVRMNRRATINPDCGLDRRMPQPAWASAIGLSLGNSDAEQK